MLQLLVLVCVLAQIGLPEGNAKSIDMGHVESADQHWEPSADRELVLTYLVHRHGERTPDSDELSLSGTNKDTLKNLTAIEGLEGLTNMGKRRGYQLGKFIRERYGSDGYGLLSNLYLQDEVLLRSTDKERTKMMIQTALAAVYPPAPEQQWNEDLGRIWQPIPYTAVPLSEDYLRYYSNCKKFKTLIAEAKKESLEQEFKAYENIIPIVMKNTGRNLTEDPLLFQTLFDLFRSQTALGLDIPEWAKPLLPSISEAAKLAYKLYFRTDEMKKIGGGVLLHDFITAANEITSGEKVKKPMRWFSAHDFNIGSLMEVSKVVKQESIPEYGAAFALELYRLKGTNEYTVLPVYLPKAGESTASLLNFAGCESSHHCDYSKFKEMTKEFLLPERDFYQECGIRTELANEL